jgi:hypothetical protein
MEIIIALLVVAGLAFYLIRKNKEVEAELQQTEAAYKVEAPVVESVKVETPAPVETAPAPVATEEIQWPKVEVAKQPAKRAPRAKKPAAPRAPAKPKAVPAKTAKPKAPAIKATPAKKPRAPRAK